MIRHHISSIKLLIAVLILSPLEFSRLLGFVYAVPFLVLDRSTPTKCVFTSFPAEAFVDINYTILGIVLSE